MVSWNCKIVTCLIHKLDNSSAFCQGAYGSALNSVSCIYQGYIGRQCQHLLFVCSQSLKSQIILNPAMSIIGVNNHNAEIAIMLAAAIPKNADMTKFLNLLMFLIPLSY